MAAIQAEAAHEELERCAGSQFDPVVVRAFLDALDGYAVLPSGGDVRRLVDDALAAAGA